MTKGAGPDRATEPDRPEGTGTWHYPGARRIGGLALTAAIVAVPLLAGCGSGSGSSSTAATAKTCAEVSAALSDGPDPGADPVGYAEAQIQPLRAIRTSDPALRTAVGDLANAYAQVFASNGKSSMATRAVAAASRKVDAICPGATS
jgi:hypothetical protein